MQHCFLLSWKSLRFLGSTMGIAIANRKNRCDFGVLSFSCRATLVVIVSKNSSLLLLQSRWSPTPRRKRTNVGKLWKLSTKSIKTPPSNPREVETQFLWTENFAYFKWHRTSISLWGIAQMCLCETKCQGGVSHHFGGVLTSLTRYCAKLGYRSNSIAISRDLRPRRWPSSSYSGCTFDLLRSFAFLDSSRNQMATTGWLPSVGKWSFQMRTKWCQE